MKLYSLYQIAEFINHFNDIAELKAQLMHKDGVTLDSMTMENNFSKVIQSSGFDTGVLAKIWAQTSAINTERKEIQAYFQQVDQW